MSTRCVVVGRIRRGGLRRTRLRWCNDEGVGWDSEELTGAGEAYLGLDDDAPPPPELLFEDMPIEAVGGVGRISAGTVPRDLLNDMTRSDWAPLVKQLPYDYPMEPYEPRSPSAMQEYYPRLYDGEYGPTAKALTAASTPSGAFFFFIQPTLWKDIADKSNDYFTEKIDERVEGQYNKQVAREKKHPNFKRKAREQIKTELEKTVDITARELCVFVGLLVARTIAPNKEKLEHHWKTVDEWGIPRGCFGQFMTRDRFMHLS
ncbi:unnamed protein product [Phytophthora fragariaefolia]|uniref:Unnamed protein product n=1 Tax=Phytophthora fragariaefolia TaxID=1490495 RepID=A0A9W6U179_9STRA|nr:unnamed protein product [Phytophthora fragariaefolia]